MTVVVSHPTGAPYLRAVLRALGAGGRLDSFWTALAVPPRVARACLLGERIGRELGRRAFPEVPWARTRLRPGREAVRIAADRLGWHALTRHETGWASVDRVYRQLDRAVAAHLARAHAGPGPGAVRAVYAYEDGARDTFKAARARGLRCIYDLPIAHWRMARRLLAEEAALHPAWAPTMQGLVDSQGKLARKDEELALADRIVVASSFTRRSVEDALGAHLPLEVAPYGAPAPLVERPAIRLPGAPLHVLYAGHLSQRKGLVYLIAALRRTDIPWRLTLAGPRPASAPAELVAFLGDPRCTWLGHVPHRTLLQTMTRAHAFVFPSIVEGFGMVLTEAMAAGLPVVTTPNTAGPDIMTDGCEGFIVPIRDPDAIAERLALIYGDETRRREMAAAALACAARSGWETYEARISHLVEAALADDHPMIIQ
jgi:glycosyltransferase involved in cell wall biosynthesis